MPPEEVCTAYLQEVTRLGRAPSTVRAYRGQLAQFLGFYAQRRLKRLGDLSAELLDSRKGSSPLLRLSVGPWQKAANRLRWRPMGALKTIQLGEICKRLEVRERDARYVLEQGYVPRGIDDAPASGNYRQFGPRQAFWLGMLLRLKAAGIRSPLAAKIADHAEMALPEIMQNWIWDWPFLLGQGKFDTRHRYFVDVGDLEFVRFVTDAHPGRGDRLEEFDWHPIGKARQPGRPCRPWVIIRLDLTKIAQKLADAFE